VCYKQLSNNKVRISVPKSLLGEVRTVKLQRRGGGRDCMQMILESLTDLLEQ
jgi:hypothetical protein